MPERRPNPEKMLARVKEEEIQQRGKLKIYLGAAPGVGKTYTMLQDAVGKREQGLDVIAGIVESHGRKEIQEMLQGLEILPQRVVDYHGKSMLEFDLDAAFNRNPGLILIDEMAHTNVPGLRHNKRWQDIKELLDRGIDVYTTLNVQHIESLNDIVAQIIGIRVRETVPDSLLEIASMEVVDLPPDDLLKRLQEGKVYIPAQAELATQHFFRKGNLTALRELALRFTAERVDEQVLLHRRGQGIEQTWPTRERLLVCIGSGPASTKVIRAAKRMATSLHAEWIAVHIETPRIQLSDEQRTLAIQNLRLAEQLGAETRILTGLDVVKEITHFAQERNVTKIIMGKHQRSRWRDIVYGSLVDELVRGNSDIDIYIVRGEVEEIKRAKIPSINAKPFPLALYGLTCLVVALATAVSYLLYSTSGLNNILMVYLLGVVIISLSGRFGPSAFASFLSVVAYGYFFIPPQFEFTTGNFQYFFTLLIMLLVSQVISNLTILNRHQAEISHLGEQRTAALHVLTRQLATTRGIDKLLEIAVRYINEVFDSEVQALLGEERILVLRAGAPIKKILNPKDQGVAQWVYELGQIAGLGTDTLPYSDSLYVPLRGAQGPIGVLKVRPKNSERLLIPEQQHLLEACANQIALALEVDRLQEKAKETQVAMQTERLRTALLSSVAHELQNPLAVIVNLIDRLAAEETRGANSERNNLIENVAHEVERLNRLIINLLQITQLEEGKIILHKKLHSVEDLINSSLHRMEKILKNKPCIVKLPPNLPSVPTDKVLMEQVLVNLIENAIIYTPPESPIEISAAVEEDSLLISVADRGPGLMLTDVEKIFENFYRGQTPQKESGAGLGLSVCKSIIKAHGGRIWAENRWEGGAAFYFVLPLQETSNNL